MTVKRKNPVLALCIAGFFASLMFSRFVYPNIAGALDSKLANDGYDQLAYGLARTGTLSFYPSTTPTVLRGPAYPLFVAALLRIGENLFPLSVQFAQALLHALTLLLSYHIGMRIWNQRAGIIAGTVTALHPFLLWYTPRIVTETLATFLFTLIVLLFLVHHNEQSVRSSVRVGVALGISALCKQTFLPLMFIVPLMNALLSHHPKRLRNTVIMFVMCLLLVGPWTMRNYSLTGAIVPVHGLLGFNLKQGDCLAERYQEAPLSYMRLINLCGPHTIDGDTVVHWEIEKNGARAGVALEKKLLQASLERYLDEPLFFLKKIAVNTVMFWTISGSAPATIVTSLLQLPLLGVFLLAARRVLRERGWRSVHSAPLIFMMVYFLGHVPIYALARFGLVMVPVMVAYAAGILGADSSLKEPFEQ